MRVSCASWPPTRRTSVSVRGRRTGKSAANPIALKRSERATGRAGCVERLCAIGTKRVVDARDRLVAASPLYGPRPPVAASRPGPARAATRSGRTPAAALDRQQPPRAPSRLPCVDLTAHRNPQAVWQTHARIPRAKGGRREWRRDARRKRQRRSAWVQPIAQCCLILTTVPAVADRQRGASGSRCGSPARPRVRVGGSRAAIARPAAALAWWRVPLLAFRTR